MKKLLAMLCALMLLSGMCLAESADFLAPMEETVILTTCRTMTETAVFDDSNPEKKSYQENRWINAYLEKLNIDVDFSWVATDDDSNSSKWSAAIATGNVPDFAYVNDQTYKMLLESDLILDCTDLFNEQLSDQYKSLLAANDVDQLTYDGKIMGIPFPTKGYMGATMLFVRQDWLDKLDLAYPTNFEELANVARAFKEAQLGGEETIGMMFSNGASDGKLDGFMNMFGAYLDYWIEKDGKLTYSNIQPEMRTALTELQALYAEGVINQDFAVTTADLAKEFVAGGKTGVFFATSWNTTTSIQALYENDPEAVVVPSVLFGANGEEILFQTNTPVTGKIFISKDCKNPEAVLKLINLTCALTSSADTYPEYGTDASGHMWFKYIPLGDMPKSTLTDIINAYEIEQVYPLYLSGEIKNGSEYTEWTNADNNSRFDSYCASKEGTGSIWSRLTYGEGGVYTMLYYAYMDGLHLPNAYVGLATETQSLMGDIINDPLRTAMYEVIMGADISVYDEACETWLASGGEDIIAEVNEAAGY